MLIQPKLPRIKFFEDKPGEPYMPSNGSEGEYFHAMWCEECERDKVMNGSATVEQADCDPDLYCKILSNSFCVAELPEWRYGDDGQPCCTAFVPKGEKLPTPRCEHTADMFAASDPSAEAPAQNATQTQRPDQPKAEAQGSTKTE
jgi:hypothetical protein